MMHSQKTAIYLIHYRVYCNLATSLTNIPKETEFRQLAEESLQEAGLRLTETSDSEQDANLDQRIAD